MKRPAAILREAKEVADETIRNFQKFGKEGISAAEMEKERARLRQKLKGDILFLCTMTVAKPKKAYKPSDFKLGRIRKGTEHEPDRNRQFTCRIPRGNLTVQMGILRSQVNISDLEIIEEPASYSVKSMKRTSQRKTEDEQIPIRQSGNQSSWQDGGRGSMPNWINIWTMPILSHLSTVRVVHGKGTGALRKGIHEFLRRQKHVKSYRLGEFGEGDAGVTIVELEIARRLIMVAKQKILIVDDDENIAELISLYLVKECFDTKIVYNGEDALSAYETYHPNLILLDLMLPGIDGYQVCREIRAKSSTPIIMLSAKGEVFDKVLGLELGADDYIMKPFDSKEMVARVRAVLRRYQPVKPEEPAEDKTKCVEYDGLTINLTNYSVVCDGHPVEMPPKELELLYFLAASPNQVFTREQLLDQIWGYEYIGDTRTVDVHIKRLREKIKDHPSWGLSTVWGIGYKFEVK